MNESTPMFHTEGTSPKAIAAAVTSAAAPIVVTLLARLFGLDVEVGTVVAVLGPIVLAAVTYLAAYLAKPGLVVPAGQQPEEPQPAPEPTTKA